MLAPEAALLLLLRLAAQCRERGGCAGAARGRRRLSQDAAASQTETASSNISHISAARAASVAHIAKTDAATVRTALMHQCSLRGFVVIASASATSSSCGRGSNCSSSTSSRISSSGPRSGVVGIVEVAIAVAHCQRFVVAVAVVIIAAETTVQLQLLLAVLWANGEASS